MQDAPYRACRTRRAGHAGRAAPGMQDAPRRACRTRRTGHAAHAGLSVSHALPKPLNPAARTHHIDTSQALLHT